MRARSLCRSARPRVERLFSVWALCGALLLAGCQGGSGADDDAAAEADAAEEEALPGTDIFLVDLDWSGDGAPTLGAVQRMTDRADYDDQPRFDREGRVLYTSQRDGTTDIYRFDPATGESAQVTTTPENDYSPTLVPGREGFSTVRVEEDGSQRMWWIPEGEGEHELLLRWNQYVVGYHEWFDDEFVAVALVDSDSDLMDLSFARITNSFISDQLIDTNIGRCLQRMPRVDGTWVAYVSKGDDDRVSPEGPDVYEAVLKYDVPNEGWWLRSIVNGRELLTETLIQMPDEVQDFAFTSRGGVLTSDGGSNLLYWNGEGQEQPASAWSPIGDLAEAGLGHITRLSVSPDDSKLAVVTRR